LRQNLFFLREDGGNRPEMAAPAITAFRVLFYDKSCLQEFSRTGWMTGQLGLAQGMLISSLASNDGALWFCRLF